jgi:HD-GYP domain-containing protein (c-di-GMP phosphodiesterase class II)
MILGLPVYDLKGNQILPAKTRLNDDCINLMIRSGVTEIFIIDARVSDVLVGTLFSPELENALANAFRQLVNENSGRKSLNRADLEKVYLCICKMAKELHLDLLSDINVSCCVSQKEYKYLQPVKAAELSMGIGHKLGMSTNDLIVLGSAAVLKDVGFIPSYLQTAATVGDKEKENALMKEHPVTGYNLLKQHDITNNTIAETVLQHHEFWNGSGFPRGLKGEQISRYAQIVNIADTISDLISEKPGRGGYMSHEAMEFIMAYSNDQFNPELVEFVVRKVPSYPTGLTVQLNSGEIAIVSDPNLGFIARPTVRICWEPEKGRLAKPYDMDLRLSKFQHKLISKVLEYD